jgi:uncharacterized protein with HEPN domain
MKDRLGNELRLKHMLDAIHEVENYTEGIDFLKFSNTSMIFFASLMQIEIIGEASSKVSEDIIESYNEIPWKNIKGLRNIIAHEYFGVDKQTIWDVITNELPKLKVTINKILEEIKSN